jgi:hypothetical protein
MNDVGDLTNGFGVNTADGLTSIIKDRAFHRSRDMIGTCRDGVGSFDQDTSMAGSKVGNGVHGTDERIGQEPPVTESSETAMRSGGLTLPISLTICSSSCIDRFRHDLIEIMIDPSMVRAEVIWLILSCLDNGVARGNYFVREADNVSRERPHG